MNDFNEAREVLSSFYKLLKENDDLKPYEKCEILLFEA